MIRQASEIILRRPGVQNSVAFAGFDGATFTNAPNTGVIFVAAEAVRGARRARADRGHDPRRSARSRLAQLERRLRLRARAAVGAGHRHRRRPEGLRAGSRRARAARAREARPGRVAGAAGADAGLHPGLHAVQHAHAADLCRHRPHQGRAAAACRSAACSRRCRSIWARPTSTTSTCSAAPTRSTAQADNPYPPDPARRREPQDAQRQRRHGADRLGRRPSATPPGPSACRATISIRRPRCRCSWRAASRPARASPRWRSIADERAAAGLRLRMDRDRAAGEARRQYRDRRLRAGGGVRLPAAGGAVRKLAAAARRHPDRADVHPGGDDRRQHPRARPQHPGRDRPGRAGRPGRQERHPDRRVRQAGRGGRA